MNIIKFLRKPYLGMFLASLMLFTSCSQYEDNVQKFDDTSLNLAKNQLANYHNFNSKSSDLTPREIMEYFKTQNNLTLEFSDVLYELSNNTIDENISIIREKGILNDEDFSRILNFENDLGNDTFENTIANFELQILELNISNEKFEVYNTFVNALKLANTMEYNPFSSLNDNNKSSMMNKSSSWGCTYATVVLAAAIVSCATLTAASGGLAIGAAVVGYLAATAAYIDACKPN